jgi:Flp pilus assembly pilin Flp
MMISKKAKGQGAVEYAGAIVVAAAIVGAVLAFGPDNLSTMFNSIITTISTNLNAQANTALQ